MACLCLAGCGSAYTVSSPTTVTLNLTSASVQLGQSVAFTAAVSTQPSLSTAVTWEVNGLIGGNTFIGTVSAAGVYTAPVVMPASATVTITAVSQADSTKSASAVVTLTLSPVGVSISPLSATVQLGLNQAFTATVTNDPASKGVLWQVNGVAGGNASVGTISAAGLYSAPVAMLASATVTITAVSQADSSKSASAVVTLKLPPIVVTISPMSATVQLGLNQAFTATVANDPANKGVVWQVNGIAGGNASVGTISAVGLYSAPVAMPASATVTITAVSQADSTKSASAVVTLKLPPIVVTISPVSATVQLGLSQAFTATVANDLLNKGVVWQVNGIAGGNASVGIISAAGLYSAPVAMPASATVTITAVSQADSTKSASAVVTLTLPPIVVTISPVSATVQLGLSQAFTATVANDLLNKGVVWQVNGVAGGNASVGTISAVGLYSAPVAMPASATVTITAVSQADSTKSASAVVTLKLPPIVVSISPVSATVQLGLTQAFTATVTNDPANKGVLWQVNGIAGGNASVGTISAVGLYSAPVAMPASATVTITAVSQADSTKSASAVVTLTLPPIVVSISPVSATVQLGLTQVFTAMVASDLLNKGVVWQVNGIAGGNASVGTISAAGLYSAPVAMPASATVTITAVSQADSTKSASAVVTLKLPPIVVTISPVSATVQLGLTQAFTAAVTNDPANKGVLWQVNGIAGGNNIVGTISAAGVYSAPLAMPASATVTITAVSQADSSKSASATVTLFAPAVSVTVTPPTAMVQVLLTQQLTATVQNDLQAKGVVWDVNGVTGGNSTLGTVSATGLYTAPANVPSPATVTVTAHAVADPTKSAFATLTVFPAPQSSVHLDRIDFGNATSETAHSFQGGDPSPQTVGIGAFGQTYRQPRLILWPFAPESPGQQLTFTMAVNPTLQNYVTVKLFGSDTQFGVMKVLQFGTVTPTTNGIPPVANSPNGELDQFDNNNSSGDNNPPAYGLFHYATLAIPQSLTIGQTTVTLTIYSTGYYYSSGSGLNNNPTRPIYSAFTHTNPYFVPPSTDQTGVPLVANGYTPPVAITQSQVDGWKIALRGEIFEPGNQGNSNGFFEPGGQLEHDGICPLPLGTPGAPPEVMGLSVSNLSYGGYNLSLQPIGGQPLYGPPAPCRINAAAVAAINATPSPADTWRNVFGSGGDSAQSSALDVDLGVYLLPPLIVNGAVMKGYDDYHDPALLAKIVGELDGLTRMYNSQGGYDSSCLNDFAADWAGLTTTPRQGNAWTGSSSRQNPECISFDGGNIGIIYATILRLLNDPFAAPLFNAYLAAPFDANLDGHLLPRAYAYERMGYTSRSQMFFDPIAANYSPNASDKSSVTTTQALIAQQAGYSGQLVARALQALYPNPDPLAQSLDPALMRSTLRQLLGLDVPVIFLPLNTDWRVITAAGTGETHGTLSSGFDGRYGAAEAPDTGNLVFFSQWDNSLSATDRQQFAQVTRNCISAYDHFLYPQLYVYTSGSTAYGYWIFAQEDVISYRVPYGPNADAGGFTWFSQVHAADPNGPIQSPYALRSFYYSAITSGGGDAEGYGISNAPVVESIWNSLVNVAPSAFQALPAEPGQPDFAWADIQDGAVSIQFQGERLLLNAQYNRPDGGINNVVRLHYITPTIDREATVMMPYDATTVQNDGNLSAPATSPNNPWVVRYGKYLIVLNNSNAAYAATLPTGQGNATLIQAHTTVPLGTTQRVPAGSYEVFVLPQ